MNDVLRPPVEVLYQKELELLKKTDDRPKPPNWELSPWAVVLFLMGGKVGKNKEIEPKYFGDRRLIELAVSTLVTDRALLLTGIPGTAKTWVAENLAAAISGNSSLLVQGSAGLAEEALRYSWNYAQLIAKGPSEEALVPSPILKAMQTGKMARVEELTRIPSDVQDTLITILSEKILPVPELNMQVSALKGFNLIATANDRDKGVNELSSALQRRFNTIVMPLPATLDQEVKIVQNRVEKIGQQLELPAQKSPVEEIRRLVTIFRELRSGRTEDGNNQLKSPSGTLSTAEAISVFQSGQALAAHFGDGQVKAEDIASSLTGVIVKEGDQDLQVWQEYLETVLKKRKGWEDLYEACSSWIENKGKR
jgi:MoxR-like ATPase